MEVQELIFAVHPGMTDHLRTKESSSTPTPNAPTPSAYSASTPTPSASTSSALISSEPSSNAPILTAHTPRAFLTRISPSKPDVHADVTPAAPESYVTVVRHSYPKRLNR